MASRSDVWYHFEKHNENNRQKGKCHYCSALISIAGGATSNLRRHLAKKHPTISIVPEELTQYRSRSPPPVEVSLGRQSIDDPPSSESFLSSTPSSTDQLSLTGSIRSLSPQEILASPPQFELTQSSIQHFVNVIRPISPNKSRQIDIQLLKMFCSEFQPFSLVENKEFKEFVSMLCPSYVLPGQETLSNSLLPALYNSLFEKIVQMLEKAPAVCLTCDSWTNINSICFNAVTAHFFDRNANLISVLLECSEFCENHTSENISIWLKKVFQKFRIDYKICAIVTGNATNMEAAIKKLDIRHISCFSHRLNLVVRESVEYSICNTVAKVKAVVQFFKQSPYANAKLSEFQGKMYPNVLKLKQDVPTRWNSTYDMLERFFENKEAVTSTLAMCNQKLLLNKDDWKIIKESLQFLKIFSEVTEEFSAEKNISLSKTCIMAQLLAKCTRRSLNTRGADLNEEVNKLASKLLDCLKKRFGSWENDELISQSIFLDPRFKKLGFGEELMVFEETKKKIIQNIQDAIRAESQALAELPPNQPSSSTSIIWKEFDESINEMNMVQDPKASAIFEVENFIAEDIVDRRTNPMEWWQGRKTLYPHLYSLALEKLCIPSTSVSCEKIFSKGGHICTQKRSRLVASKIEKMLFINHNSFLI